MQKYLGLVFGSFLFISFHAKADILIEPLIGYQLGTKVEIDNSDSVSGGMGPAFGGRVGYQQLGLQVGLDYLNSSVDMDNEDFKKDLKTAEYAAFVGYEFPLLFKAYVGYIFSMSGETSIRDDDNGAALSTKLNGGSGFKAGVGFTLLPLLDINLEYRNVTVDDWKVLSFKMNEDLNYSAYTVSLSIPFTL